MVIEKRRFVVASELLEREWGCILSVPEGARYAFSNHETIFSVLCSSLIDGSPVEPGSAMPGFNTPAHVVTGVSGTPEDGIQVVRVCLDEEREHVDIDIFCIPRGKDLTYLHPTSVFVLADP